jgi:hypothetical protein
MVLTLVLIRNGNVFVHQAMGLNSSDKHKPNSKGGRASDQNAVMKVFVCQVKILVCYDMDISQKEHAWVTGYYSS